MRLPFNKSNQGIDLQSLLKKDAIQEAETKTLPALNDLNLTLKTDIDQGPIDTKDLQAKKWLSSIRKQIADWNPHDVDYGCMDLRRPWPVLPEPIEPEDSTLQIDMQSLAISLENLRIRQKVDWVFEIANIVPHQTVSNRFPRDEVERLPIYTLNQDASQSGPDSDALEGIVYQFNP